MLEDHNQVQLSDGQVPAGLDFVSSKTFFEDMVMLEEKRTPHRDLL